MTRPRIYTIGHKVNSLLSEPSLSTCETWLLPHACILHMLRYHVSNQGEGVVQDGHQDRGAILPSLEGPVQPPNNRTGGTTGRLPPKNRPPFCDQAVQGRYSTRCTGKSQKTGTTGPTTGTTAGGPTPICRSQHLTPTVVPPSLSGTSALHESPAVQPPHRPVQPACLRTVYWAEPVYPFALTYPFVALDYIYSSTSS